MGGHYGCGPHDLRGVISLEVTRNGKDLQSEREAQVGTLFQEAVKPLQAELNALKKSVEKHVTEAEAKKIYQELEREGFVTEISDAPKWAQPELRILLDTGAINGGTDADVNPNDVNMPIDDVKVALICKRYVDHALGNK